MQFLFFKLIIFMLFIVIVSFFFLINAKHVLYVFLSLELLLISIVILFLILAKIQDDLSLVSFSIFLLGLIASETAVGLILVIYIQKNQIQFLD